MTGPPSPNESRARLGPAQATARALLKLSPHERVPVRLRRAVRPLTARIRSVGVRQQDVLIASYPRSGSTWIRFLLTEILMKQPAEWPLVNRVIPDVGDHGDAPALLSGGGRLIKTHDRFVGPSRRAIYIVRDVRDVVLSEYRWELRDGVRRTLDEQIDLTLASGTPMSLFGSWRDHVTYWLGTDAALRGDLLVVKFEEFRRDPRAKLDEVLGFLGVEAAPPEIIEAAIRNSSVERMKEREGRAVNAGISGGDPKYPWIGQGAVMGWRSKLTPEQAERLEAGVGDVLARFGYPTGDQPDD